MKFRERDDGFISCPSCYQLGSSTGKTPPGTWLAMHGLENPQIHRGSSSSFGRHHFQHTSGKRGAIVESHEGPRPMEDRTLWPGKSLERNGFCSMLVALELEIFSDGREILRGIRLCAITVG